MLESVALASGQRRDHFRWEVWTIRQGSATAIVHTLGYFFVVLPSSEKTKAYHWCELSPGRDEPVETLQAVSTRWGVRRLARKWGEALQRELAALDWLRLGVEESGYFSGIAVTGIDEPFTDSERAVISHRLEQIERAIIERHAGDAALASEIRTVFRELRDQSQSLRRGMWVRVAIGTVVQLGIRQVLAMPEVTAVLGDVMSALRAAVHNLVLTP